MWGVCVCMHVYLVIYIHTECMSTNTSTHNMDSAMCSRLRHPFGKFLCYTPDAAYYVVGNHPLLHACACASCGHLWLYVGVCSWIQLRTRICVWYMFVPTYKCTSYIHTYVHTDISTYRHTYIHRDEGEHTHTHGQSHPKPRKPFRRCSFTNGEKCRVP